MIPIDKRASSSRRAVLAGGPALGVALNFLRPDAADAGLAPDRTPLFDHVRHLTALGEADRYGYRMPGTPSDHAAARFVAKTLGRLGLRDVTLEPVPVAIAFPDAWSLEIESGGAREALPCSFIRYAGHTPDLGTRAEIVHLGLGSAADFAAHDVRGKIVVVDIVAVRGVPRMGAVYATYDRNSTIEADNHDVAWPLANLQSSYNLAVAHGAAGWIGALEVFGDDTCEYHHWYARYEIPALTISATAGRRLKARLKPGDHATLTLTGRRGQGLSYNVYGTVPGRRHDHAILVKSHHDGWATNEASGTAVALGVAQRLADPMAARLENDVVFFFRACHFGVGWTLNPPKDMPHAADAPPHADLAELARIYGMEPDWDRYPTRVSALMPKLLAANNIEMIGRQYRRDTAGVWRRTDEPAVRHWGVTGPRKGANAALLQIVRSAIETHDLDRSQVSNFLLGDGWDFSRYGVPTVNLISHNVFQFTSRDRLDTVMEGDLDRAADAFASIVRGQDKAGWEALRPAVYVGLEGFR